MLPKFDSRVLKDAFRVAQPTIVSSSSMQGKPLIGSTQWIQVEKENVMSLMASEREDFHFAVRNEVDWLNEFMTELCNSSTM